MSIVRRRAAEISSVLLLAGILVALPGAEAAMAAAPTIGSFTPTSGPVGTSVEISGDNFTGSDPDVTGVTFNGTAATFTIDNPHKITATVPSGATTGPIAVTSPDGTATSSTNFTVTTAGAPTITSFNPTSGPVGTSVQITGTNFTGATAVKFNGVSATFTVQNNTHIDATVPSGATTGPISVTTPGGTATSSTNFTVTASPVPTITSFDPTSGPVGTSVRVDGTGFTGATAVRFNGVSATFSVNSNTRITATVPSGATTGPVSVTTPGGTATSASSFTVTGAAAVHERKVTLRLVKHLVARGSVTTLDGFDACGSGVSVKVQRRRADGGWHTVGTDETNSLGGYRELIPNRSGTYRAVAVREELSAGADTCARDTSGTKRYTR